MELRNCPECGRLFRYTSRYCCLDCMDQDERLFLKVRSHLADNRGSSAEQLAESTGVALARITRWLREGRLELYVADGSLTCECCDEPVRSGRFCPDCRQHLEKDLSGSLSAQPGSNGRYNWAEVKGSKRG